MTASNDVYFIRYTVTTRLLHALAPRGQCWVSEPGKRTKRDPTTAAPAGSPGCLAGSPGCLAARSGRRSKRRRAACRSGATRYRHGRSRLPTTDAERGRGPASPAGHVSGGAGRLGASGQGAPYLVQRAWRSTGCCSTACHRAAPGARPPRPTTPGALLRGRVQHVLEPPRPRTTSREAAGGGARVTSACEPGVSVLLHSVHLRHWACQSLPSDVLRSAVRARGRSARERGRGQRKHRVSLASLNVHERSAT